MILDLLSNFVLSFQGEIWALEDLYQVLFK